MKHGRLKKYIILCAVLTALFWMSGIETCAKASDTKERDFANVVLFAHFSGENAAKDAAFFADRANRDRIIGYFDGTDKRSLKNYLETVSYGKFHVKNIFPQDNGTGISSCQLSIPESLAQKQNADYSIINELIEKIPGVQEQVVDYNGDGIVDNLTVILKGEAASDSGSNVSLQAHKSDYSAGDKWGGKYIGSYNMISTDRIMDPMTQSGVIIHEFLHSLGYPDLYRGSASDPSEPCTYPVGAWDIMAGTSYMPAIPLAYLRMYFTGWLDIETVTKSATLTLDAQDKADGNQAYILRSPLNEHEIFVVEFRKRGNRGTYNNDYEPDSGLLASGVIVYRVNPTATALSNHFGQTGIYVFRPREGDSRASVDQDGNYNERASVNLAALAVADNKVTSLGPVVGSADLSKGIADGALTYSDGTNSGIVVSTESKSDGDQMTIRVEIPEAGQFDMWKDTGFTDTYSGASTPENAQKAASVITYNGTQYAMIHTGKDFQLYKRNTDKWEKTGSAFSESTYRVDDIQLFSHNNELYFAYLLPTKDQEILYLKKYAAGTWNSVLEVRDVGAGFDAETIDGELYFAYTRSGDSAAVLGKVTGTQMQEIGEYYSASGGQPKICTLNGKIYVSIRTPVSSIKVYSVSNGKFTEVNKDAELRSNTYDMVALEGKIYLPLGGSDLKVASFDGSKWEISGSSEISCYEPRLVSVQGNLYVIVPSDNGEGNIKVYQYNTDKRNFVQEGINVDSAGEKTSFAASENQLYLAYLRKKDSKIIIKAKDIANELQSLTVTPPKKTTYIEGDPVETDGLKVVANYIRGTKELNEGVYQVSGFDTDTVGERIAKVSYEGKENIFPYEVLSVHQHIFNNNEEDVGGSCQSGLKKKVCSECGFIEIEGLSEEAHSWSDSYTVDKEADCTSFGSQSYHCTNCGAVKGSMLLEKKPHDFSYKSDGNATCTKDGTKSAVCSICGAESTVADVGSRRPHAYVTSKTNATLSKNGSIVTTCKTCGAKKDSTVIYYPKTIALSATSCTYNGKVQTPSVTVTDSAGRAISSASYNIIYPGGRKAVGVYTVKIVFKGNYSGTVSRSYNIVPKNTKISRLSRRKKRFTVKWKKQTKETSGYEIQYSTAKNFKSGVKTVRLSRKKTSRTIKKLKAKKRYYVRIRTYKTVKAGGRSVRVYSGWSGVKSVKTK